MRTLFSLIVAETQVTAKPVLPIAYDMNLLHISLTVGDSDHVHFNLSIAFDTLAVLNVGNTKYYLAIAKKFSQVVKNLIWAGKNYNPLKLSGVVGKEEFNPTTLLPAITEYHMVYKTVEGSATTLKVALGNNVAINTIIGMSTIKAAKMTLDMADEVVDSKILKFLPLEVTFRPVQCTLPDFFWN